MSSTQQPDTSALVMLALAGAQKALEALISAVQLDQEQRAAERARTHAAAEKDLEAVTAPVDRLPVPSSYNDLP